MRRTLRHGRERGRAARTAAGRQRAHVAPALALLACLALAAAAHPAAFQVQQHDATSVTASPLRLVSPQSLTLAALVGNALLEAHCDVAPPCGAGAVTTVGFYFAGLPHVLAPAGYSVAQVEDGAESGHALGQRLRHVSPAAQPLLLVSMYATLHMAAAPTQPADLVAALALPRPAVIVFAEPSRGECVLTQTCAPTHPQFTIAVWTQAFREVGYALHGNFTAGLRNAMLNAYPSLWHDSWVLIKNIAMFYRTAAGTVPPPVASQLWFDVEAQAPEVRELLTADFNSFQEALVAPAIVPACDSAHGFIALLQAGELAQLRPRLLLRLQELQVCVAGEMLRSCRTLCEPSYRQPEAPVSALSSPRCNCCCNTTLATHM